MNARLAYSFRFALVCVAWCFFSGPVCADVVYVWSYDGTIMRCDASGVSSLITSNNVTGWNGPVGLALDNVGNLYAGVPRNSSILKYSPDGAHSMVGCADSVSGLAFDGSGGLYITIPNFSEIARPVWNGGYGLPFNAPHSQAHLSYPINICVDDAGTIYVVNGADPDGFMPPGNTIEKFSTDFTYFGSFATNLNNPWGLAFDGVGNLYVSNSGTNGLLRNTILRFTTNGVGSVFVNGSSGLSSPRGLAFDSAGNLYVANCGNGTIQKFTPEGAGSVFVSGLKSPTSVAVFPGLHIWSAKPITLLPPSIQPIGSFQFDLAENAGLTLKVLATTNCLLPVTNWPLVGAATELSPGGYRFIDTQATNNTQRFYRILAQ